MTPRTTATLLATALAACDAGGAPPGHEGAPGADAGNALDAAAPADDDAGPLPPLARNDSIETVLVWSQNIRMRKERWQNAVRCMADRACNGLGALPDVILLQEASCADTAAIAELLAASLAGGGAGVAGWDTHCVENFSEFSAHWMSNGIVYRSDRFQLDDAVELPFESGDGSACALQGKTWPVVKLLDLDRAAADKLERRVTFAVRHDDHFGAAGKNTCDAPDAPTVFCTWDNSKRIDDAVAAIGGGLLVMAGDWNYAARRCSYDGVVTTTFKHDYACSTKGLAVTCDGGATANLGWRDPILEADPAAYDTWKSIDFMHARDTGGFVLNQTERNARAGVVGQHFYCEGHGPYDGGEDESARMSDHGGRFASFHY